MMYGIQVLGRGRNNTWPFLVAGLLFVANTGVTTASHIDVTAVGTEEWVRFNFDQPNSITAENDGTESFNVRVDITDGDEEESVWRLNALEIVEDHGQIFSDTLKVRMRRDSIMRGSHLVAPHDREPAPNHTQLAPTDDFPNTFTLDLSAGDLGAGVHVIPAAGTASGHGGHLDVWTMTVAVEVAADNSDISRWAVDVEGRHNSGPARALSGTKVPSNPFETSDRYGFGFYSLTPDGLDYFFDIVENPDQVPILEVSFHEGGFGQEGPVLFSSADLAGTWTGFSVAPFLDGLRAGKEDVYAQILFEDGGLIRGQVTAIQVPEAASLTACIISATFLVRARYRRKHSGISPIDM